MKIFIEIEGLKKVYERELELVWELIINDYKKLLNVLKKEIVEKNNEIEKYYLLILLWEKKLEIILNLLKK